MALPGYPSRRKSGQINLRVTEVQRNLLERAARLQGKNRTEFIIDAAVRAANQALDAQATLFVDEEAFAAFERLLNEPVAPTGALRELFATKAPWE